MCGSCDLIVIMQVCERIRLLVKSGLVVDVVYMMMLVCLMLLMVFIFLFTVAVNIVVCAGIS